LHSKSDPSLQSRTRVKPEERGFRYPLWGACPPPLLGANSGKENSPKASRKSLCLNLFPHGKNDAGPV
jgi:hypothetical protein